MSWLHTAHTLRMISKGFSLFLVCVQAKQIIWMRRTHFMRRSVDELITHALAKRTDPIWWWRSCDITLDLSLCAYYSRKWNLCESLSLNWNDKYRSILKREFYAHWKQFFLSSDANALRYPSSYEPEDALEWGLVLDEIKGFIKADAAVSVLHADSNPIVLSHR